MENLQEYIDDLKTNTDSQLNVELESLNRVIIRNLAEQKKVIEWIKDCKNEISEINELEITYSHVIKNLEHWTDSLHYHIESLNSILKRQRNYDQKKLAVIKEQNKREACNND